VWQMYLVVYNRPSAAKNMKPKNAKQIPPPPSHHKEEGRRILQCILLSISLSPNIHFLSVVDGCNRAPTILVGSVEKTFASSYLYK
jgi:hypothetical protein